MKYPAYPLHQTCNTSYWLDHPQLQFFRADSSKFKTALAVVLCLFQQMTFLDLLNYYEEVTVKVFHAGRMINDVVFYDLNTSIHVLEKLIDFQCGTDSSKFWVDLFNVLECKLPKRNTLQLIGPPGAGKSYFVDCVSAFVLNVGNIANFNRSCNFPLQDAKNRSLLVWNEPNFTPESTDTLKMLLGGDPCAARMKYENDYLIPRTPVIMTGNKKVLPDGDAFGQRVLTWCWISAPWLKECKMKPNPMAIKALYNKYSIKEMDV